MKTQYPVLMIAGAAFGAVVLIAISFGVWTAAPTSAAFPRRARGLNRSNS
jgi:hypothetical protein